jgi:hypothetical protein
MKVSPQSIEALVQVISGGRGMNYDTAPAIGKYRSASQLESFMRNCGVLMSIGSGSRLPTLSDAIRGVMQRGEHHTMRTIIESAADPRDFVTEPDKLTKLIEHLNQYLIFDGLELQHQGQRVRLVQAGTSAPVLAALAQKTQTIDFDTVQRDLERANTSATSDPEDAVTAACSVIESVCRSVLVELEVGLPDKRDLIGLFKAVREPLGLSPGRTDLPAEVAEDVRQVLSGLHTMVQGIGALRTHAGDAHGRERGYRRIDARIARLAIHSASAVALFIIETWQQKYPTKQLIAH